MSDRRPPRELIDWQISPDLWAWLEDYAEREHKGVIGRALVTLISNARDTERAQEASRRIGGTAENPDRSQPSDNPWGDISR